MPDSITKLPLAKLRLDGGTQPRATIDDVVVDQYAVDLEAGAKFPPVIVYHDGTDHWLADGFHRAKSHEKAGRKTIDADVRQGTQRDAILHSVGVNNAHGLPRTNADKRRAVQTILTNDLVCKNESGQPWSDRAIAKMCAVSAPLVGEVRSSVTVNSYSEERAYTTKHGTVATMNTANIGRPVIPIPDSVVAENRRILAGHFPEHEKQIDPEPKPRRAPADDQLDGGVMDPVERRVSHTVTLAEREDIAPAPRTLNERFVKNIHECMVVFRGIRENGGIEKMSRSWRDEERIDYIDQLTEFRNTADQLIQTLETSCKTKKSA